VISISARGTFVMSCVSVLAFLLPVLDVAVVSCLSLFLGGHFHSGHFLALAYTCSGRRIHIVGVRVTRLAIESLCGVLGICSRGLLFDVRVGILVNV